MITAYLLTTQMVEKKYIFYTLKYLINWFLRIVFYSEFMRKKYDYCLYILNDLNSRKYFFVYTCNNFNVSVFYFMKIEGK